MKLPLTRRKKLDRAQAEVAASERSLQSQRKQQAERVAELVEQLENERQGYQAALEAEHQEHELAVAHYKGQLQVLQAQLRREEQLAHLVETHQWHIGGQKQIHEFVDPLVQYECGCGATLFAKEGEL